MSDTWYDDVGPDDIPPLGAMGWLLVVLRSVPLGILTFGGLILLLLVRLVEAPLFGSHRPVTPFITQSVCRGAFLILGMRHQISGTPIHGKGAVVANHSSWLDIFALNARQRVYFVSKSEVARWPGIGWLARATGTAFIERRRSKAAEQKKLFEERIAAGHQLLFFPEGTSSDGLRVLPFKPTLLAAFFSGDPEAVIQPVTVQYQSPDADHPRFYGWWGDMEFGPHLIKTLGARRQGGVKVTYHAPMRIADFADRKALAKALEAQVRSGFEPVD